jgi:hypothetical protein
MTTQEIMISSLTGTEVAINLTVYMLYGYSTALIFTVIGLFGYVGIHAAHVAYLRAYVLLSMIVTFVRIIEFMTSIQQQYILLFMNIYSISVCLTVNSYIKNVSQVVIGNPVQDEDNQFQNEHHSGTEYKVASIV